MNLPPIERETVIMAGLAALNFVLLVAHVVRHMRGEDQNLDLRIAQGRADTLEVQLHNNMMERMKIEANHQAAERALREYRHAVSTLTAQPTTVIIDGSQSPRFAARNAEPFNPEVTR